MTTDDVNLYEALLPRTRTTTRAALVLSDGTEIGYRELDELAARYATAFEAAGMAPGDRVLSVVGKSVNAVAHYLGTLRGGGVFVPLNPAYTRTELEYFLADARPVILVIDPARADEAAALCDGLPIVVLTLAGDDSGTLEQEALASSPVHTPRARSGGDTAAILYTSGTTGRSKGAMLSHGNLLSNARALRDAWHYTADDVLVHALPLFHTHGLFVGINVSLLAGATVLLQPRFDADEIARALPSATVLMGVPTYYSRLLERDDLADLSRGMRLFISGSAPLLSATHRTWRERTGHEILERYGMTETTMLTSNPFDGERRPGTVGLPLAGVRVRIADADAGGIGSIEVAGPNVFAGYWQMPDKTAESFTADGFFVTGDLGRIDDDGYVHIVGRAKDLVIRGGENVYPKEVEGEIDAMDGVVESAVYGVPDADLGERVVAAVVLEERAEVAPEQIADHLAERLAPYKRPSDYVFVPALPRNVMGKVQKSVLRDVGVADSARQVVEKGI